VSAALELTDGARARIQELEALSHKAEAGEAGARQELRQALRESAPEVIVRCSDTARVYRRLLAKTASGNDMLKEDAIVEQARMLASEVAGENPTPLEVLLAERIASLWVLVELLEALHAAYFVRGDHKKPPVSYLLKMVKVQESANRRYLAAIKTLAQVRKLQVNTPGIQFNTQINVER
jgi:DNA mismatch repair ATPase MutS